MKLLEELGLEGLHMGHQLLLLRARAYHLEKLPSKKRKAQRKQLLEEVRAAHDAIGAFGCVRDFQAMIAEIELALQC